MKYEANISKKQIVEHLNNEYPIQVYSINFLPLGEDGWTYKIVDESGKLWFLKLRSKYNKATLAISTYLRDNLNYTFIPETLKTKDGHDSLGIDGLTAIIQQYIDGKELKENNNLEFEIQVGRNLKQLFDSMAFVPKSIMDDLPRETFKRQLDIAEEVIRQGITNKNESKIEKELGQFIKSQGEKINLIIKRNKVLGERLRHLDLQFGICHADIHTSNILVNKENKLFFIDWDSVMLAPRERDLFFYSKGLEINKNILEGYDNSFSGNKDLLSYYKYEWVVQEFADYGKQIFFSNYSEKQKEYALESFIELFNPNDVVEDALYSFI